MFPASIFPSRADHSPSPSTTAWLFSTLLSTTALSQQHSMPSLEYCQQRQPCTSSICYNPYSFPSQNSVPFYDIYAVQQQCCTSGVIPYSSITDISATPYTQYVLHYYQRQRSCVQLQEQHRNQQVSLSKNNSADRCYQQSVPMWRYQMGASYLSKLDFHLFRIIIAIDSWKFPNL